MLKTPLINQHDVVLFPLEIWLVGAIGVGWALSHISCTRSSLFTSVEKTFNYKPKNN